MAAVSCVRLVGHGSWCRVRAAVSSVAFAARYQSSQNNMLQRRKEAVTSLSKPPWPEIKLPDPVEEAKHHLEVVQNVKALIATGAYSRLFAVIHFASRQWKVTDEDLILIENHIEADCGDRIRLEKVLLVGGDNFTLIGRPLLGRDLVRVEATVIEKTESWPRIHFRFKRRKRFRRTKINVQPQTILRINTIKIAPALA